VQNPTPHSTSIIAHRGNSSEAPENTLLAFQQAFDLGVDYVECDVQLSKRGIPILTHDLTDDERPSLHELLEILPSEVGLMIDVKRESYRGGEMIRAIAKDLYDFPRLKDTPKPLLIGSLDPKILQEIEHVLKGYTSIAIVEYDSDLPKFFSLQTTFYALYDKWVTEAIIQQLHARGKVVWIWTVDEVDKAGSLASWGADGIITNRPRGMLMQSWNSS